MACRVREIGIRMALDARTGEVLWLILRETFLMVCIGALIGIPPPSNSRACWQPSSTDSPRRIRSRFATNEAPLSFVSACRKLIHDACIFLLQLVWI
jgi:hypothetical protein